MFSVMGVYNSMSSSRRLLKEQLPQNEHDESPSTKAYVTPCVNAAFVCGLQVGAPFRLDLEEAYFN